MSVYTLKVKVDQIVTREIKVVVSAKSEDEAGRKAIEAVQTHPDKVEVDGIKKMCTIKARYWIPRDTDIVSCVKEEKTAA